MSLKANLKLALASLVAGTAAIAVAGLLSASAARADDLKSYDSSKKEFWTHPPDDWFMGDETKEQKGTHVLNTLPPPTGFTDAEVDASLKQIKLPPGFKIELWARVPAARQMALGDKGTLFVGSWFGVGKVFAVTDEGGKRTVKPVIEGLTVPTGVAFRDGALYVADINKLYKYADAETNLGSMPKGEVVYDDMPAYIPHGWKYLAFDKNGWLYIPFGPPCNECLPPTSTSQIRHVNPANGLAETVALGVRNSVGGDVDPRTGDYWFSENARDWLGDDLPSDKLNHITKIGEHFGYPYCHQGDIPDPKLAMGHKCSEFSPPALKLGAHMAPLGMKFYTGDQFPADYKNNIILAEHGSWNRHQFQGGRLMRITADPDGKNAKEVEFASGWIGA
ncbi:MAG TPA: PQQ-dependent sugar dehydrogenase, partial [Xanthobacteraceae bacterium]|nr:PQQ-dependent sugar dehydrogenase [Xanthobacteraceae bacterium]